MARSCRVFLTDSSFTTRPAVDRDQSGLPVAVPRDTLGWRQGLSTDGYVSPLRRLELHGKMAWLQADGVAPFVNTYLVQGRAQVTIQRFVDAALESRYIREPSTHTSRRGTSAEAGFWPAPDFRVALGYSFDDTRDPFGRDREGRDQGVYLTLSTKLSRLFDLMGSKPLSPAASAPQASATIPK